MTARPKFTERKIYLLSEVQRATMIALASNLPLDADNPLEVVVRERVKTRGLDANARMWVGPLKDIAQQVWSDGRQFTEMVWHEYFKGAYLPDDGAPESDPANGHVKDGYRKWDFKPDGSPMLVGSTTQLTKRGFALYLTQVEAFGANMGVEFSASPNEVRA
jgi:hypothetical protein